MYRSAPTLACADYFDLEHQITFLERIGAYSWHIDIMDGNAVPNYCLNWDYVKALRKHSSLPVDIHLMVTERERDAEKALETGAERIAIHKEGGGEEETVSILRKIRKGGAKAGIVLNPETAPDSLISMEGEFDYILLMAVRPGFAGQSFRRETLGKIERAKALFPEKEIWVDGGVDFDNSRECEKAGADVLIAGALCIFRQGGDFEKDADRFIRGGLSSEA